MRVVSGTAKGKKLFAVPGDSTRPILDRVKTALFDILRPTLSQKSFLDIFAGSGSVGIEALSQGAQSCVFTDIEPKAIETIKRNLDNTNLLEKAQIKNMDAFSFLKNTSNAFDIIYVAPPQYQNLWVEIMYVISERPERVNENGILIVQIDPKEYENLILTAFVEESQRKYGNTLLVFYRKI